MKLFVIDESYNRRVLILGSIVIDEDNAGNLVNEFLEFKKGLYGDGNEHLPFKWNLSGGNKAQRDARSLLLSRSLTKKYTHPKVIELISGHRLLIVAVVCEDVRNLRWPGTTTVDFYCWAFKFLLTRFYFMLEDEQGTAGDKGLLIADIHPRRKLLSRDFNRIMQDCFYRPQKFSNRTIPALREHFLASFSFGYAESNCLIQICDCIVGCTGDWINTILDNRAIPEDHLFREIVNKFRCSPTSSCTVKGYGFKVFPNTGELYGIIPSNLGYL